MIHRRPLGQSGVEISSLGFGAWAIGGLGYSDVPEADALDAVHAYLEAGGRHIDTARGYGISEILCGRVLKEMKRREETFVASKSGNQHPPAIRTDCLTSNFCTGEVPVDLYYIHVSPAPGDKLDRMLDAYAALKEAGHTKLVGISAPGRDEPGSPEALAFLDAMIDDSRVDVIQLVYSLARPGNAPMIARAVEKGVGIVARTCLEGGLLTGRYKPGHVWKDKANDWRASRPREQIDALLERVEELSGALVEPPYESLGQVALAWVLADPNVSSVIVGGKNRAQVEQNLAVTDLPVMDAEIRARVSDACSDLPQLAGKPSR
jgi:aryl-alcohol dehydrogenase-like predicted oxidoreductase